MLHALQCSIVGLCSGALTISFLMTGRGTLCRLDLLIEFGQIVDSTRSNGQGAQEASQKPESEFLVATIEQTFTDQFHQQSLREALGNPEQPGCHRTTRPAEAGRYPLSERHGDAIRIFLGRV